MSQRVVGRAARSIAARWSLVSACLLAACGVSSPAVDETWHEEAGARWRALPPAGGGADGFTVHDAEATGIVHRNDVSDEHALANRHLLLGAGVAVGDVDEDGRPDLFFASVERPAALYRNEGGFRFRDVTAASGIATAGLATMSATFADVDGDRHLDLLVGTLGGPVKLWTGDGRGRFTDATAQLGLTGTWAATALALADVDADGDLDLYVGTYKTRNALDAYPPQDRSFEQVVRKVGNAYRVVPEWEKEYRIEDRPDLGGIMRSQRAEPDLFLRNDGTGRFTREPIAGVAGAGGSRFRDERGEPLRQELDYFTLAARFHDVNADGAPDLYVCNDFEDPDQLWINDGKGGFRLAPALALRQTSNTCMSVDFADVNRDGHVDFFTADMASPSHARRQTQFPVNTPIPKRVGLDTARQQWMRNALQLGRGDGTWAEAAMFAGVEASEWTWGSAFTDVDLDGWDDLLVVNGHRWDVRDADTFERIRNAFPRVAWNREQGEFPRHAARSVAFRYRAGDGTFVDRSVEWHFGDAPAITNGIALGDLDGDGDQDVVTTRLGDTPLVHEATTDARRIAIRLRGTAPNVQGIGAQVTARRPGGPVQSRQVMPTGYYLSGSDAQLTFAAIVADPMRVEVRWPSGRVSVVPQAVPGRLYEIDEAAAGPPVARNHAPDSSRIALFEDATALLGGHAHVDSAYDDYRRQPLLPNKFSQLGPGVSWIDVDDDGREDLVVGTGRGGRISVLRAPRAAGARFAPLAVPGAPARWDVTTLLPVPTPGGLALVYGQASWEADSAAEALSVSPIAERALARGALLPPPPATVVRPDSASVGPLALGDVDGDGQLELFVGARAIPGAWPLPAKSRLYRRAPDGAWTPDTLNARALGALGLVSAATFTDLDGDGRPELVATSEWGPVRVLHNDGGGRLRDVTREWGVAAHTSRWNGVAAGDFDGDGRMDLLVTSWGRNSPWRASADRPYELVLGNFGGAGLGLVFAREDSAPAPRMREGWRRLFAFTRWEPVPPAREVPLESFARLGIAVPDARRRFASYGEYARASVDEVLGDHARNAVRIGATTFDHWILYNRGGRFDARIVGGEATLAPAFGIAVADFDGDGAEDAFLAQNFSPTAIETPRLDAGAGVLLRGVGAQGRLVAMSVNASGIRVLGDGRGAAVADFDADGRPDLAVAQNGAPTTLWRNRGARPGLRVRLAGPPGNPWGIGAQLRVTARGTRGPVRELHAGGGYWSMDAATTVMALPDGADSLVVRWPGGREQVVPLAAGQREIVVAAP